MAIQAGGVHYMTFPHSLSGRIRSNFTVTILKNGAVVTPSIAWSMREVATGIYTFQFTNDGTHQSTWTMIVSDSGDTTTTYVETWRVEKPIVEQNVKFLRSQIGLGGYRSTNPQD